MVVSKFKIDAEEVPLMIPKLCQAQNVNDIVLIKDFLTNYLVSVKMRCFDDINPNAIRSRSRVATGNVFLPFKYNKAHENITTIGAIDSKTNLGYINNLNPQCYFSNYSELVNTINEVISDAMENFLTVDCINKFAVYSHAFF